LIELGIDALGENELGEKEIREHPSPKRVDSDLMKFELWLLEKTSSNLLSRITSPPHERVYDPDPNSQQMPFPLVSIIVNL